MAIKVNNTTVINDSRSILNSTGIEVSGIVTASPGAAITYYGDGSNLTGVSVSAEFNNITTGIITASAYDGFVVADTQTISDNFEFNNNKPNLTFAQDLVISPGVAFTVSAGTTVTVNPFRDIEPGTFEIPSGTTEERQGTPSTGALRYNTELNYLEFYNGTEWRQIEVSNISSGKAISGYTNLQGTPVNATNIVPIESFNIKTGGESQYFGFLTRYATNYTSCSSSTRGLFGGGNFGAPSPTTALSKIDYVTIASDGNSNNFGDLTIARQYLTACSNETRGIFGKGSSPGIIKDMDYVTIATTGDAIDFGDLVTSASKLSACSNPVKGIFAGGEAPVNKNEIEFTIINSNGTGYDFGNLTINRGQLGAVSSNVRGVFAGGSTPTSDILDYITIASEGNAINFGDPDTHREGAGAASDSIRGIFMGGTQPATPSAPINTVEFITIATLGDAIIYGSLPGANATSIWSNLRTAMSNGHGGLG